MTFMLHAGGNVISRDEIQQLPPPEPLGPRHRPLAYAVVLRMLEHQLQQAGMTVVNAAFGTQPRGSLPHARLFALYEVSTGYRVPSAPDTASAVQIGIRGSINKSLSWAVGVGARTFVCDNEAFSSQYILATKSSGEIENKMALLLREAVSATPRQQYTEQAVLERFRGESLANWQAERYMVAAYRAGVVGSKLLGHWIDEFDKPSAGAHAKLTENKLRLYMAGTAAMRDALVHNALTDRMDRTLALRDLIDCPYKDIESWERPHVSNSVKFLTDDGWRAGNHADLKELVDV